MTYLATRDLLFRAVVARGFHDPALVTFIDAPAFGYFATEGLAPEKIWSYEVGLEANTLDLLRVKLAVFYHDIDDILIENRFGPMNYTMVNGGSARTAGGEFGVATNSFKGFVFKSGVHYEQVKLLDFSDPRYFDVRDVYGVNGALAYDGGHGLKGVLKARYLWWDMTEDWKADSNGVVVDVSVTKEVSGHREGRAGALRQRPQHLQRAQLQRSGSPEPGPLARSRGAVHVLARSLAPTTTEKPCANPGLDPGDSGMLGAPWDRR